MSNLSLEEIKKLKDDLKQRGYKLTPQRRAILDGLVKNEGKHLTVEEIYDDVKLECPEIGLATVYRTVLLLEEMGIIYRLDLEDGCARYELVHENENHRHHHLVCSNCGKVIEVEGDLLDTLEVNIESKYNFKIMDHSVKFFGLCDECQSEN
ncbi:Fur family transcriptional regulator, ferric uptake regulator [Clostridium amylolyticum]|uniref:Fur family transcriptional regulator, ferric uptake regulator n=1 Tax=Clostridium amylolyticum TaxID=1121298 RepID=A0A1M6D105_9CLOT|nr:Fur family transcriptional regulator [Clostridium amylolyticum]SHI66744.1 Fur family transcriptional regulator, ferric uptake regulator [Clostridium amylolyticum]